MRWLRKLAGGRATDDDVEVPLDPDLSQLLDEHGLIAFDRQIAFSEVLGDRDWTFDQDDGILRLGDDITLAAQILGSTSSKSNTWLWAWANPSIDEALAARSREAARLGGERGMTILVEPKLDLGRGIGDGHLLALAVAGLLDADAYFRGSHAGGHVFLLVDEPRAKQFSPEPEARAVTVISEALRYGSDLVTPTAIANYLRGLGLVFSEDVGEIRIGSGESGTFQFDELGRLTEIRGTLGGDPSLAHDIDQR